MNHPRSAIKEARLRAILDAATELLIQKPTASLNEIAEYAGIGIATLHRYIESREQLMLQLGLRALQVVGESMRQIPLDEEKLEDYIPALIEALIPLGDKIYFLTHDATLYYSEEIIAAEHKLKELGLLRDPPVAGKRDRAPGYERGLGLECAVHACFHCVAAGAGWASRQKA